MGLAGLGGLGLAAGLGTLGAEAAEPLNIINTAASLTMIVAQLMKTGDYYKQFGVDTNIINVTDGSKVIAALVSGNGDLCGSGGFSGVFPAVAKGASVKIIANAQTRPDQAIYTKRADIKTTKDLEGKTVGTGALGALLHELAVALLIKKGVDYTKVNFVNVGSAVQVFQAVAAGSIDAGLASVDVFYDQEKYGVHNLTDGVLWKELPEITNQAVLASDYAIANKRDQLVRALAAQAKLYRFISSPASKDAWIKARIASMGPADEKGIEQQWEFYSSPGQLSTGLIFEPAQFDVVQQLNVKLGAQDKVLPFDQVADMSIARDALKLLGA
jgi:ABC-type nitrate/sulfonate/bicarbonate transport system substrate-binding protein